MFEVQLEIKIYQFGLLFVHEINIYNINRFVLQEIGRWCMVSDCEELVGVTQRKLSGIDQVESGTVTTSRFKQHKIFSKLD